MRGISVKSCRVGLLLGTAISSLAATAPAWAQDTVNSGSVVLEPITLEGSSYETEGSNSYATDMISVGEKAAMSPREVPQSTSVVTRKQIEDGGYTALEEALADMPGLLIQSNDSGRSAIFSRGYEFDYLYFDGLPAPIDSIYGTQPDLAIVDHVEILKGPAGLFIGTGEPAGSINMRLKQAKATELEGYVSGSANSNGHGRIEADFANALNRDGTLRGRAVLAYGDGDGSVDGQENGVAVAYGTLAWDITPDTLLTFSLAHMQRDIAPFNGLPTYADGSLIWLDPGTTTGAEWNHFENSTTDAVAALEHRFDSGARVKASLRASREEANFLYAFAGSAADANNVVTRLNWLDRDYERDSLALDVHAELPFTLGQMSGNAIIGADWQKVKSTQLDPKRGSTFVNGSWDLDNWDTSGVPRPPRVYDTRTKADTTSTGLYTQVRLKPVDRLTVIGGARLSWYDTQVDTTDFATGAPVSDSGYEFDAEITPFAGLTYDITPNTTVYGSYSSIFTPVTNVDKNGNLLEPRQGTQYELGIKSELAYGLNLSAALFDLREENRPRAVPGQPYFEAEEEVRTRGLELEVSGEVLENLHLAAGYTYTDTEFRNGPNQGAAFSSVTPEHMFKLTAMYDVDQGALAGWSFGGRMTAVSDFSSRGIEAPGYTVVDLMAARDLGHNAVLRLGIDNAFGKEYYKRVGSPVVFNIRGEPRTFTASLTKRF